MEKECTQCHRIFHTTQEFAEICPECLQQEFRAAARMDDGERQVLADEFRDADKRQLLRAKRMQMGYSSGAVYNWAGKLRFAAGCILFLVCCLVFLMTPTGVQKNALTELSLTSQRLISLMVCVVSAALVATSSSRRPMIVYPAAVIMLLCGWKLPECLKTSAPPTLEMPAEASNSSQRTPAAAEAPAEDQAVSGRALTAFDLDVFTQQKASAPHVAHYAVYMDHQDARTRSLVRDALSRLLEADFTRAYTRNNGALYVVCNVPGKVKNISPTLERFGHVTYSAPKDGIYEVRFDSDKTNMVSRYPVEVLTSPIHSSYVAANLCELTCIDPMRVRAAAKNLRDSDVKVLRREIHDTLLQVLQDPWTSDPDTYSVLAEAMAVYAYDRDAQALEACRRYFRAGLAMKREIPERVTDYLVTESPDEMVEPIVEFWCENPIVWGDTMARLGIRVQGALIEKLKSTDSIRRIGTIIRYLKDYGDARAIPAIEPFLDHSDSIIRHSAQDTINVLKARQ